MKKFAIFIKLWICDEGKNRHFRVKLKPQTNGVWFRGWWRKSSAERLEEFAESNRNHPAQSRVSSTSESNLRNWDQLFRTFRTEKLFINSKMNCRVFSTPTFYISPRFSTKHHLFLIRCDLPQHIYWLVLSRWPEKPFLSCTNQKMFHNKAKRIIEWFFVLISHLVSLSAAKLFINLGDIFLRIFFFFLNLTKLACFNTFDPAWHEFSGSVKFFDGV